MEKSAIAHQVLLNDFGRLWRDAGAAVHAALERVGASGWYILGPYVAAFEEELARAWKLPHAVGVASGLDALEIALRAAGIGSGDRVLTTPLSAFASTLAILKVGAVPVFVDCDERGHLDIELCRAALRSTPGIRAVIPVHLYGIAMDLDALDLLRRDFGVVMIEDCAQAIGATWKQRPVGSVSELAATSFYPTKNLGAMGDGGAVLMSDPALAARARALRNYGETSKYHHEFVGLNSRLDELHAAILSAAFLPRLEAWTERRRAIARSYINRLRGPHVRVLETNADRSVWHLFPVIVEGERRVDFIQHMTASGVTTGVHYPSLISEQPAMRSPGSFETFGTLTKAAQFCRSEVSIPIHPYLTDEEVDVVIDASNRWKG